MGTYFNIHNHTMYSNIRLLDCINRPKDLIDKAIELGLSGIAITDHECLSAHMEVNQYAKEIKKKNPDFVIVLGNEVYLVDKRENGIKYYHFILAAKDEIGHKALRELSSIAWYNSYVDRGMERVPITKEELRKIMSKYKGHVVASTACMGGELSTNALAMTLAEDVGDIATAKVHYDKINEFMAYCMRVFGDDFYIEIQDHGIEDQATVLPMLLQLARKHDIQLVATNDCHYINKEDSKMQYALICVQTNKRLSDPDTLEFETDEFYVKSTEEMYDLFSFLILELVQHAF